MRDTIKQNIKKTETKRGNIISLKSKPEKGFSQNKNSPVEQVLHLQRTIGNRAVNRLIRSGAIQAKLTIGKPNDIYEKEADRVADRVMSMPETSLAQRKSTCPECPERKEIQAKPLAEQITPLVQRQAEEEEEVQAKQQVQRQTEEEEELQTKPLAQRQVEEEEEEPLQAKAVSGQTPEVSTDIESSIDGMKGGGQPLSESTRAFFEPRFGADFSQVRVHNDSRAANTAQSINAKAFTTGNNIAFNSGQYSPETSSGKNLLAHELTHVVQQDNKSNSSLHKKHKKVGKTASNGRLIQRRVYVSGAVEADTNEYVNLLGTAAGYSLTRTFRNPQVRIIRIRPGNPPSPSARSQLKKMIDHPTQHAEVHVGTAQPGVAVGAFPIAPSMIQLVDIDDIRNLNATTPGAGTAKAYHELFENWTHHGAGTPGFGVSHEQGVEIESSVVEELGTPGRRMAGRDQLQPILPPAGMPAGNYLRARSEFTTYFLELIYRVNPGNDFQLVRSQRIPKVQVSQNVVNQFGPGIIAIPAGGNVILNRVVADLNANADRTVAIEAFTDSTGSHSLNLRLSRERAESARAYLIGRGIAANRINIIGRGETNFVDTNGTAAGRANNRRVVLTVHRPGP